MKAAVVALALAACSPAQRTAGLSAASTSLLVVDAYQTRINVEHCKEGNPVIGLCGEGAPVGQYFATVILMHLAIGAALPERWRRTWFGSVSTAEAFAIANNFRYPEQR